MPPTRNPQGLLKRSALNVALLLGTFAIAAVLSEGVVRLVAPQQLILLRPDIWQPVDVLGWAHRPNVSTLINTGERPVHIFTDSMGFRVGAGGRPPGRVRVLLLGDSFMAAFQVEHEQSVAGLMQTGLSEALGETVEVWNTGVGGWGPSHYLLQLRELLGRQSFDLVLVAVYLGNDVEVERVEMFPPRQPVNRYSFRMLRAVSPSEFIDAVLYPLNDVLEVRSHAFILAKHALGTARMRVGLTADYFPTEFLRSEAETPRWEITAGVLNEIAQEAANEGIPCVFALVPAPHQVDREVFARSARGFGFDMAAVDLDQPNRLLGESLRSAGHTVIDAVQEFQRAHEASGPPLFGRIDSHLSPEGHEVLYRVLEATLVASLRKSSIPRARGAD
jgi:hypothetical protein